MSDAVLRRYAKMRANAMAPEPKVKTKDKSGDEKGALVKLRVSAKLKDQFTAKCHEKGVTPSRAIRRFMEEWCRGRS